jgi:hypothetical protein
MSAPQRGRLSQLKDAAQKALVRSGALKELHAGQ